MKTDTEIQNAQIGTLIQEFTGQAVAFYDGMKEQPVCRPAKETTLEHLEKQTIPAEGRSGTGSIFGNAPGHLLQYDSRAAPTQLFLRSVHGVPAFLDGRCHDRLL